jgi:tetratricopeptide (TPR) repeat protein
VWKVLVTWFPEFDKERLDRWAGRFLNEQPGRRLTILNILKQKLISEKDFGLLAITQQNIGETLMKLNEPNDAAAEFAAALKYYRDNNIQNQFSEELVRLLMEAYLEAGDYARATEFAQQSLTLHERYQPTVGSLIQSRAGDLVTKGQLEDARRLADLAVNMNPPLKEPFISEMRRIAEQVRQKLSAPAAGTGNAQSATSPSPIPRFEPLAAAR